MSAARKDLEVPESGRHQPITTKGSSHVLSRCRTRDLLWLWPLPTDTPPAARHCASLGGAVNTAGWGGRIRTFEYGIQSPAPYRLATPHPGELRYGSVWLGRCKPIV